MQSIETRIETIEEAIQCQDVKLTTLMQRTERLTELGDSIETLSKLASMVHRVAKWLAPIAAVGAACVGVWATIRGVK